MCTVTLKEQGIMIQSVPKSRLRKLNSAPVQGEGEYILYWMTSARRPFDNFGLQHALHQAHKFGKPLVVLEALRIDYQWSSERFHQFVLDGMAVNKSYFDGKNVTYLPYLEREDGAGKGLLEALAQKACAIVTDYFPCFFIPRMIEAAARKVDVSLEQVDSNGALPLFDSPRAFTTAYSFRRHLQKEVLPCLLEMPMDECLAEGSNRPRAPIGRALLERWPMLTSEDLSGNHALSRFNLFTNNHVSRLSYRGGFEEANRAWSFFLDRKIARYHEDRNQPELNIATGLSPYLHFGHVGVHRLLRELFQCERWNPTCTAAKTTGSRAGWWGMGPAAEAFIDQLLTWRELGYTHCHHHLDDYEQFETLPSWALTTLEEHESDPRNPSYNLASLEAAETHDPLWNAAQRQLVREGRIHNYLRMLWGKKILEWSEHPRLALHHLIELNNKYSIDGRNPNSYSGIFWTLGRFDRAWGARPIFGKVRYMSSENTARKLKVKAYLNQWA